MNKKLTLAVLEALRALYTMQVARVSLPHGDCESVAPTFNICPACPNHTYCINRHRFLLQLDALEKMCGG